MRGYKVVHVTPGGRLVSAVVWPWEEGVEYFISEATVPKEGCGPLAVFPNKGSAVRFRDNLIAPRQGGIQIFSCKYSKSKSDTLWNPTCPAIREYLPLGTRFADSVTLIKEVPLDNLSFGD